MGKHYSICLLLLCLIATSCENTILKEEDSVTQVTTRSSITKDDFARDNSIFYNLQPAKTGTDVYRIAGDIKTYSKDVEYDFTLWCQIKGDVKCVVWVSSGEILYNGKVYSSIYGINGKDIKFTLRFNTSITNIKMALETTDYLNNYYKEANARLVISGARYKGEEMGSGGSVEGGSYDLWLQPIYPYNLPAGTTEFHWKCSNCGAINAVYNNSCHGCGQ